MYVAAVLVLAVLVGWLATLIMQSDIERLSIIDFIVGIAGAGVGDGLLAPAVGISPITPYGFGVSGILVAWLVAMLLLAATNLVRRGTVR